MEELIDIDITHHFQERVRSLSIRNFEETNMQTTFAMMRNELDKIVNMITDSQEQQKFTKEMKNFLRLFGRYLTETTTGKSLNWAKIKSPAPDQIINYKSLLVCPREEEARLLVKLAVVKLNGGLGTTMGCVGPKSIIEVRDGLSFLDLSVIQIENINKVYNVSVPLLLMNSFNTNVETERVVKKYSDHVRIVTFTQSQFPRIFKESLLPCPKSHNSHKSEWYPPGHGDIFDALTSSKLLDTLIEEGKEWIFISNIDNLGATIDTAILKHLESSGAEFVMEVTDKTKSDIKGGTLIDYEGSIRLLELAQVSADHLDDFKSIKKFKIFNTNNIWISTRAIKRLVSADTQELEIITNVKSLESGEKIIQLETAVGAAIRHFKDAHGLNVPRSRFLPVKSTSDLFLMVSDLYSLDRGRMTMSSKRLFGTAPIVKLGDNFKKVSSYLARFKGPPTIMELDHLTVSGDVTFGVDVTLKGTVIIVASHGSRIDIPSGTILEDKVVTGNLRIMDH